MTTGKRAVDKWRAAVLSADCDLPPLARLVAIVMAMFMDWDSLDGAYPGPGRVAARTGMHVSTVKRHLALLCERGWLIQTEKGFSRGGERRASVYAGSYPSHGGTGTDDDPSHGARGPVAADASTRSAQRGDPSHSDTPPCKDPVKDRGPNKVARARSARPGPSGRLAPAQRTKSKSNVGTFSPAIAGIYDKTADGETVRREDPVR
jgi:hypothetical protein